MVLSFYFHSDDSNYLDSEILLFGTFLLLVIVIVSQSVFNFTFFVFRRKKIFLVTDSYMLGSTLNFFNWKQGFPVKILENFL